MRIIHAKRHNTSTKSKYSVWRGMPPTDGHYRLSNHHVVRIDLEDIVALLQSRHCCLTLFPFGAKFKKRVMSDIMDGAVRISGFLAFLGIGFGFGVASWLISRVIVRSVAPPSDDTATKAVPTENYLSVEHGDKASSASSVRRRGVNMGNEHGKYNETVQLSELRSRLEDDGQISSNTLGASIHEPHSRTTVTRHVPAYLGDCTPCDIPTRDNGPPDGTGCEPDVISCHTSHTGTTQCSEGTDNESEQNDDTATDPMAEEADSGAAASMSASKYPASMKDSGYGCDSIENHNLEVSPHSQHGLGESVLAATNAPSVRSSISDATDRDLTTITDDKTNGDSHQYDNEAFESCLETSNMSEDHESHPFHAVQRCSTSLDNSDEILIDKACNEPTLDAASAMKYRQLFSSDDSYRTSVEDVFPSPDTLNNHSPATSPAAVRRKSFRGSHKSQCSSASASPLLSRGERSRSSSVMSVEGSFDADKIRDIIVDESQLKAFMQIQNEIVEVNKEFTDIDETLKRLLKADTGDCYSSHNTTAKLGQLLEDNSINISDGHLNKAHDLLRKFSGSQYPRNSSEPPATTRSRSNSAAPEIRRLTESQSFDCLPQRYVLHEDIDNNRHWMHADDDVDRSSVSSVVTCETTLNSNGRGSMESINTVTSMDLADSTQDSRYITDLRKYCAQEWKGDTKTAETIRHGYECLITEHGYKYIVKIRGDNYCALRAAYCSMILHNTYSSSITDSAMQDLEKLHETEPNLIHSWSFANRMPEVTPDQKYNKLKLSLEFFILKTESLTILPSQEEKRRQLFQLLNSGTDDEIVLLEAMKLLMFLNAVKLYNKNISGEDVPVFVWLLYARDTSETPYQFLRNHLNKCGDQGGLEQVEMCLLGYTLDVVLQVFRLYQYGQPDFEAHYPELDESSAKSKLPLIAEDDRHYNTSLYDSSSSL